GSGEAALGKSLHLEDRTYTIVGVVPPVFQFPARTEVWIAASHDPDNRVRSAYNYRAVAKLKADVAVDTANAQLATLGSQLASAFPDSNTDKTFSVTPLRDQLVGPVRTTLMVLM